MELTNRIGSVTVPGMDSLKITPAAGGWVHAEWGAGSAWVRFGKDDDNKLTRITEWHVYDPSTTRIPFNRIHNAVTMRGASLVNLMLAIGINETPPASVLSGPPPTGMKLEQRYKLMRPSSRRLDDAFYADVAHAYQSAVAHGLHPRKAIVADTGAADATVASWVMEARRRGHLPKAQPGRVTA
jgi:hypothetical protein